MLSVILLMSICACGNTSTADSLQSSNQSSNSRLNQMRNAAKEHNDSIDAQEQAEAAKKRADEERDENNRQKARAAITVNDELLDALVGEWGFIIPNTINEESGRKYPARLFFLNFGELGSGTGFFATDSYWGTGKLDYTSYQDFEFAIDEQNYQIAVFYYANSENDSNPKLCEIDFDYSFDNGELTLSGVPAYFTVDNKSNPFTVEYFKADWEAIWDDIHTYNSIEKTSEKYSQYISSLA